MKVEIRVPFATMTKEGLKQLDYSIKDGDVVGWRKKEGDTVKEGEILCEFETSKVTFEVTSPVNGTLIEILSRNDTTIATTRWEQDATYSKRIIAIIETEQVIHSPASPPGSLPTPPPAQPAETPPRLRISPIAKAELENAARKLGADYDDLLREVQNKYPGRRIMKDDVVSFIAVVSLNDEKNFRITPAARALAIAHKISAEDLFSIAGTGPQGCVTEQDIMRHAVKTPIDIRKTAPTFKLVKQSAMRRTIARNMDEAWKKPTAQGTFVCDFRQLVEFRKECAKIFEQKFGTRLHIAFPLVVALVRVLARDEFRYMNSKWAYQAEGDENIEIGALQQYEQINLGISYATPKGLVVLVLHEADKYEVSNLAQKISELSQKAQNNSYTLDDQIGETFIFNNIGGLRKDCPEDLAENRDNFLFVHESGYSILTPSISLEFNLGAIAPDYRGKIQICFDHRPIDGEGATNFAYEVYCESFRVIKELRNVLKY